MPKIFDGPERDTMFSSHVMVVRPSASHFKAVEGAHKSLKPGMLDEEILSKVFPKIQELDREEYGIATNDLRMNSIPQSPSSRGTNSDSKDTLHMVKVLHFSSLPTQKPWFNASQELMNRYMPRCKKTEWFGASDCRDRELWFKIHRDYTKKRREICRAAQTPERASI